MLKLAGQNLHLAGSPCFLWVLGCIRIAQQAPRSQLPRKQSWRTGSSIAAGVGWAVGKATLLQSACATAEGELVTPAGRGIIERRRGRPLGRCGLTRHCFYLGNAPS